MGPEQWLPSLHIEITSCLIFFTSTLRDRERLIWLLKDTSVSYLGCTPTKDRFTYHCYL